MSLILTPFENALTQLKKSLNYCTSDLSKQDPDLFLQFRLAAIQAFEYSHELGLKLMIRQLENMSTSDKNTDHLTYKDLIRLGAEKGLLDDPEAWFNFKELRNLTVHTYNEEVAKKVYLEIPQFVEKADYLLESLRKHS